MAFSFTINEEENLITVICDDHISSDESAKVLDELVQILLKRPTTGLILDLRNASFGGGYHGEMECGKLFAKESKYFSKNRNAILTNHRNQSQSLFITSLYTNGFKNFYEFDCENEAFSWLQSGI